MPRRPIGPDLEEAIRRLVEAGNRRPPDYDGALAIYSQDAVVDTTPLDLGLFEGREAIRGFFEDWIAAYEHMEQALTDGLSEWVTTYTDLDEARAAAERLAEERE
jgi:ketosteroid isomerase-like protein